MTYQGDTPDQEATPRKPIYKDLLLLQLVALVLLLDQFSKFLVREYLTFGGGSYPVEGFFRLTHIHNTGSAFGMFQGQNGPLILVSLIGITVLALIYHSQRRPTNLLRLSLGLQMGGAAGNFLDRLCLLQEDCQGGLWARFQQGYVTDFIDVGTWPIFNLADSSIVVGLALLAWLFLRPERFGGGRRSTAGIGTLQPVAATGRAGVYARCPICDGEMLAAGHGWHCSVCGVKERIDAGHGSPETPVVAEQSAAAWGTGSTPMGPAGANQTSSVPPSEAAPSADLATGPMPDVDAGGAASPYHQEVPGNSGAGGPL